MKAHNSLARFLHRLPVFKELDLISCERLLQQSNVLSYAGRQVVQDSGQTHHHLYIVVTGQLQMVANSENGGEMTVAIFGPGSMSSWVALYHDTPAMRSVVAQADTRLIAIPAEVMRQLLVENPYLYPLLLNLEAKRFRSALNWQQLVLNPDRTRRIAALLLMLLGISGDESEHPTLQLTHAQLLVSAQCSRQMLHVSLKTLQSRGLIRQSYGAIHILNKAGLQEFAAVVES
jgi:CRP/FNR family transcriptional regulator, cyclic AMP receptor protein